MTDRFNVVLYDAAGFWRYVGPRDIDARDAVDLARDLIVKADSDADIDRILITDQDDFTNLLWERGKGLVFPENGQKGPAA